MTLHASTIELLVAYLLLVTVTAAFVSLLSSLLGADEGAGGFLVCLGTFLATVGTWNGADHWL